jgi:hypothetical protein
MLFAKVAILVEWSRLSPASYSDFSPADDWPLNHPARIFVVPGHSTNGFLWGARILLTLNILLYTTSILIDGMSCIPLSGMWEPWNRATARCIDKKALDISVGPSGAFKPPAAPGVPDSS